MTDLETTILAIVQRHPHVTTNGVIRRIPARRETVRHQLATLKNRGQLAVVECFDPLTRTVTKHWKVIHA